jgi:hypothetical protein
MRRGANAALNVLGGRPRFRRSAGMQPLPLPVRGGSIESLAPRDCGARRAAALTGGDPDGFDRQTSDGAPGALRHRDYGA